MPGSVRTPPELRQPFTNSNITCPHQQHLGTSATYDKTIPIRTTKHAAHSAKSAGIPVRGIDLEQASRSIRNRLSGPDQLQRGLERLLCIEIGRIEMKRVGGSVHRSGGATAIAGISPSNIGKQFVIRDALAARLMLQKTPTRPRFVRCGNENLHMCIGTYDRPDIAAVEHRAAVLLGKRPLIIEQRYAHLGNLCDDRGRFSSLRATQSCIGKRLDDNGPGRRLGCDDIIEIAAPGEYISRHGTIEKTRIQPRQSEMRGDALCKRTFARRCRAIDGDDQRHLTVSLKRAPSVSMIGRNSGKLVAIIVDIVDNDRLVAGEPGGQKCHRDAVIEMGRDEAAAPASRPRLRRSGVSPSTRAD